MKKSYIASAMGLVLVALSGQAMAVPSVGSSTTAVANVEFSAENITAHTLTPVDHLAGLVSDKSVIANGDVTVSANAKVVVQPDVAIADTADGSLMHLKGKVNNENTFDAYLSDTAGGAPLTVSGVPGWYMAGEGTDVKYTVNVADAQTVPADKYDITVLAAIYTD